jgi:branched-chain amino acid transport system substrate-binding protein
MEERDVTSVRPFAGIAALVATVALAGCGSVGDSDSKDSGGSDSGPVTVGLVIPQSGVYAPLGADMKAAWDLYLAEHGNKLGGREVKTKIADEGETPDTGVPVVQKLLQDQDVDLLVGIVNSATALGAAKAVGQAKKPLVVANAGANAITAANDYIWRTSFTNGQVGYAAGQYAAGLPEAKKGAYVIAADYAAGAEQSAGMIAGFKAGGGKVVDTAKTPFGTTQDFQPYLGRIRKSGAGLTLAFYAGAEAVAFVKQYDEFGLKAKTPLVGTGFLTEGGVLSAQGKSALGVRSGLAYTSGLDNPANQKFADSYSSAADRPPTVYAMQTWDAALVLDKAIQEAGSTKGADVVKALGGLGEISESPRGAWSFDNRDPKQVYYGREVTADGANFVNKVDKELGEIAPSQGG